MKISKLLANEKVTISCELFPPKQNESAQVAANIIEETAHLKPAFISVTDRFGSSRENTVRLAAQAQKFDVPALAHLTCITSTREDITETLGKMKKNGIENILALRGDIPSGSEFPLPNQYRHAADLILDIKKQGDFCIGAACYPEGHVECPRMEDDLEHLKQKVECGCDFLTSQMFFDNNVFYNFLYRVLAKGIRVPVIAGIMPVTNARQIRRICEISGTVLPARFRAITDKFAEHPAAMKQAGIAYAIEQIIDLVSNGVNSIHIYTMNKPDVVGKILQNLSEIIA